MLIIITEVISGVAVILGALLLGLGARGIIKKIDEPTGIRICLVFGSLLLLLGIIALFGKVSYGIMPWGIFI